MDAKKWYLSKTFWVNVISIIIAVCGYLTGVPYLGPILTVLVPILNILLRIITVVPLKL
jgi:hypothetical protein